MKTKLLVIKIGGNIIDNPSKLEKVLNMVSDISTPKIIIHGGGKIASELATKLGITTEFHEGRRITTKENLDVVTMVYAGLINKSIVAKMQGKRCNSIGLTGADFNVIKAKKRPSKPIDFGHVGDVIQVDSSRLDGLLKENITPIFSSISHDGEGNLLNTNADTMAAEIAIAMSETHEVSLKYCFEKSGVLLNINQPESLIKELDFKEYTKLKLQGVVSEGMLPKLENCFYAFNQGVASVWIGNEQILKEAYENCTKIK